MGKTTINLKGTNALLVANGRMSDPSNEYKLAYDAVLRSKPNERTKKVKKLIEDDPDYMLKWYEKEKRAQFFGLLYWDASIGFYIPADNLLYMIRESYFGYGSTSKGGDRLLSLLETDREAYAFTYEGPDTPEERWEAGLYRVSQVPNRAMGGAKARVLQPFFRHWEVEFELRWSRHADRPDILGKGKNFSVDALYDNLVFQGETFGLGAYRKSPNYGNFSVKFGE